MERRHRPVLADQVRLDHHAVNDGRLSIDKLAECGTGLFGLDLGDKAEPAIKHSKNWCAGLGTQVRGPHKRAVAAKGHHEIRTGQLIGRVRLDA